jgi:hypothetical protein
MIHVEVSGFVVMLPTILILLNRCIYACVMILP